MSDAEFKVSDAQARFDAFYDEGLALFARAEAAVGGAHCRRFRIAGMTVEFRFASQPLVAFLSDALAHLEIDEPSEADFSFLIFDEESTGVGPPRVRWDISAQYAHGEVASLIDADRYLFVEQPRRRVIAGRRSSQAAFVWFASWTDLAQWERAAPLLTLINWWASGVGYSRVHGGAVGRADGGVLIAGAGGSGKSHTAIACLDSNLFYASDDHCLFRLKDGLAVASMYSTAKLFFADLHRFPFLEHRQQEAVRTPEGKAIFFLETIVPDRLSSGFPLKAILLPKPSGRRDTQITPGSASKALLELAPETVLRWPNVGREIFPLLATSVRSLPCYTLETGTELAQIPKVIATLLDRLPKATTLKS